MQKYERLTKRAGWNKDIDLKDELGYSYIYQRLAELENAIDDGEIVRLPCKVGDKVYFIIKSGNEFVMLEDTCIGFTIADGEIHIGLENIPVAVNKFYFNRKQAEKRLKELKENK